MSLALAIKKNAISLAQAQKTYKQNVVAVNTLVVGVLESNLPKSLAQKPPDWDEFVATYKYARAEALYWVDTVMARLLDIPKDTRHDNILISPFLQDAKKQAETLVDDPHNPVASEFLDQDFSSLLCQLTTVFKFIDGAVTKVKNFKNKLPKMAVLLLTIAQKSTAYAKADKKQIAKLNDDIENLRSDIEDLAGEIADLAIFEGTALTFVSVQLPPSSHC